MPKAVLFIAAGMLFLGIFPLPYGYYTLLRFVACGVFAWAALIAQTKKNEEVLPWILGVLAVVFNPIVPIYFPKEVWVIIDFCSGLFLLFVSKKVVSNERTST